MSTYSCDSGNIATAAEYDEDVTCVVDYATDTGLGVGAYGGEAAVEGLSEVTTVALELPIG